MTDQSLVYVHPGTVSRVMDYFTDPVEKAEMLALLSRINTLYMIARAGSGHIGSSFSSMDIFSWLYLNELEKEDVFFSSKGHDAPGLYAVLIGLGKLEADRIHTLRRLGGLPGHPDVGTPNINTNTGSLGMGISKAKGFLNAWRLSGRAGRVFVLCGDGELQEGQFWESLSGAVNARMDRLTLLVDHNKIQSDTWVKNVSDLGDLDAKFSAFGWHVQRCDGNRMTDLKACIERAGQVKGRPQVIIADTVKGAGVSFMASVSMTADQEFYTYHSGAPGADDYTRASRELIEAANLRLADLGQPSLPLETIVKKAPMPASPEIQKLIPAYEKALKQIGEANEDVVVLDADLMLDCGLLSFRNAWPERFIECGIAEQDMVSQAGTLALSGKIPIAHSFACFLAARANEQFFNNASERTKCIYSGSLAGMLPSGPGHSHQMVRDISILSSVPGLTLVEPCCEKEVGMILDWAVSKEPESTYIRLVSIPCEVPYSLDGDYRLEKGRGTALTQGEDAVVFSYGPVMLPQAFQAARILENEHQYGLKVVNLPWLNHIDPDWLQDMTSGVRRIYTLDNHLIAGGQGEKIGAVLMASGAGSGCRFHQLGLTGLPECGLNPEVLSHHGLDSQSLAEFIWADRQ